MKKILLFCSLICIAWACSSGQKALEKGNYQEAVITSVKRLRNSPDNDKARQILATAYPLALEKNYDDIRNYKDSKARFRWEKVVGAYEQLQSLYEEIRTCPAALEVVGKPKSFVDDVEDAKEKAAKERYEHAQNLLLKKQNRQSAREAYESLEVVQKYAPTYKNTQKMLEEALHYATLHVLIDEIPLPNNLKDDSRYLQNKLFEYLTRNQRNINRFVRFYSKAEANAASLGYPDHIIRMEFDDFAVGQIYLKSEVRTVNSKDSVQVGEVNVNGKKIPAYNIVSAKVSDYKKKVESKGLLAFRIIDQKTQSTLQEDKLAGSYTWLVEWSTFNGDERALSQADKEACKKQEQNPPPNDQLFVEFSKPIYDQVISQLRRFYREY